MLTFRRIILATIAASTMAAGLTGSAFAQEATPSESAIERMVLKVLESRPDLIKKVMDNSAAKQNEERSKVAQAAMNKLLPDIKKDASLPHSGEVNGVFVASFFDYNCGFCKQFENTTLTPAAKILANESGMRVAYIHAPILGEGSVRLAMIASAADMQGKFLEVHKFLMSRQGPGIRDTASADAIIPEIVAAVPGLNAAKLRTALSDGSAAKVVAHHEVLIQRAGLSGTPLIYANDEVIGGAIPLDPFMGLMRQKRG